MSFTCPRCERTSHNPNDEREGYCGSCHDWTGTRTPPRFCCYVASGQQCRAIGRVVLRVTPPGHRQVPLVAMCRTHAVLATRLFEDQGFDVERMERPL